MVSKPQHELVARVLGGCITRTLATAKAGDRYAPSRLVDISALSAYATVVNELAAAYLAANPRFDVAAFRALSQVAQAEAAVTAYTAGLA